MKTVRQTVTVSTVFNPGGAVQRDLYEIGSHDVPPPNERIFRSAVITSFWLYSSLAEEKNVQILLVNSEGKKVQILPPFALKAGQSTKEMISLFPIARTSRGLPLGKDNKLRIKLIDTLGEEDYISAVASVEEDGELIEDTISV